MQEQIKYLEDRIQKLENSLQEFKRPSEFTFNKSIRFKGDKVGFYKMESILQPSSTGTTSNMTTVGGTTVTESNGFAGGTGTTFYTIGDIVKHLKALGLLAK